MCHDIWIFATTRDMLVIESMFKDRVCVLQFMKSNWVWHSIPEWDFKMPCLPRENATLGPVDLVILTSISVSTNSRKR